MRKSLSLFGLLTLMFVGFYFYQQSTDDAQEEHWWRGNMHTHSLWSDGDDYPEVISQWYKDAGYHFLVWTDHNELQQDERWIAPEHNDYAQRGGGMEAYEAYLEQFGAEWVESEVRDDTLQVRLKPFDEYRTLFEEPGEFLLVRGEEITDEEVIHMNATNVQEFIPPQGGDSAADIIQRNVDAVLEQREETGEPMVPHLNHPNFHYAVTAEDLAAVGDLPFFEVFNGHRGVNNHGDGEHRVDLDRLWDITLTLRDEAGYDLIYGLAVDDSHNYEHSHEETAQSGRGWVMVRAAELTTEAIVAALEDGDFYATSGVILEEVSFSGNRLSVVVDAEEDVEYDIEFIGTREDYDASSEPVVTDEGEELDVTRQYSEDIGQVLKTVSGPEAHYDLEGDEVYVRARVTSSKPHPNPFEEGDVEMAWVQPVQSE